jgi:hypothetical protein
LLVEVVDPQVMRVHNLEVEVEVEYLMVIIAPEAIHLEVALKLLVEYNLLQVETMAVPYKVDHQDLQVVVEDIMVVVVELTEDHILPVVAAVQDIMEDTLNYLYLVRLVLPVEMPVATEVHQFLVIFQQLLVMQVIQGQELELLVVFVSMLYPDLEVKLFKY